MRSMIVWMAISGFSAAKYHNFYEYGLFKLNTNLIINFDFLFVLRIDKSSNPFLWFLFWVIITFTLIIHSIELFVDFNSIHWDSDIDTDDKNDEIVLEHL